MVKSLSIPFRVDPAKVGPDQKINLVDLLGRLLESAGLHAYKLNMGVGDLNKQNHTWVLSRMRVDIDRWPVKEENLVLETWPQGFDRLFGIRDFEILDAGESPLVTARTYWLVIDLNTRRPKDISKDLTEFNNPEKDSVAGKLSKLSDFSNVFFQGEEEVLPSDIDMNNHVTSVSYTRWIMNVFPEEELRNMTLRSYEINHISEVFLGEKVRIEIGEEDTHSYSGRILHLLTGKVAFRAKMVFEAK